MPVLHNLMEDAVMELLKDFQTRGDFCNCEQCRLDIAAVALNNLPPRYVVTPRGEAYAKADLLELQKYIDVVGAVTKAIKLVGENPRHQKNSGGEGFAKGNHLSN